ncbi:helix-turn-helix domain-containing protein [Streptomyces sp. NPDC002476]|uniref:helix-turn-helix domain-containing protein n=1 Tax=Streptomyces sp. NPDC002476 TaxID=3364648 RepID=UPI0036A7996F
MGRPIDDKDRRRVRELHAAGKSRNEIARALKRSPSTVSKIAADQGLAFDRAEQVEAATRVRAADHAARRATLAFGLHTDAERLRAQMWEPCKYGEFGGKDNKWSEVDLDRPRFGDQRQIIAAAQTAVNASLRLVPARAGFRSLPQRAEGSGFVVLRPAQPRFNVPADIWAPTAYRRPCE